MRDLEVATPRLTLRYVSDALGDELAVLAAQGIHEPATMLFSTPWTDVPSPELERNTLRFYWRNRAETTVTRWHLNLAAIVEGNVVGMCSLEAEHFPTQRTVETGSWLGRRYQSQGIGTEMRHAALHLAFIGLQADQATTSAWHDNTASLRLTRSLPYTETGTSTRPRRDQDDMMIEFAMTSARWQTIRRDDIRLKEIDAARSQLDTAHLEDCLACRDCAMKTSAAPAVSILRMVRPLAAG